MLSNRYNILRFCAVIITLAAVLGEQYLPSKTFSLLGNENVYHAVWSDSAYGGNSEAHWRDEKAQDWICEMRESGVYPGCGYTLSFGAPDNGMDFTPYNRIKIKMSYTGDASRIRVSLRAFNPAYSSLDVQGSEKFMAVTLLTRDLHSPITLRFHEFSVLDWWLTSYNIPREQALPEFDNIVTVGVDHMSIGHHELTIDSVVLEGEWIKAETLFLIIILFWMVLLLYEGLSRFYQLHKKSRNEQLLLSQLVDNYQKLEVKKAEFEKKSSTDPLTGIRNRGGIEDFVKQLTEKNHNHGPVGLLLFDVDHFKQINDGRGHDAGDRVLCQLANIITVNIRSADIFGRWGGEEFLLLCTNTSKSNLLGFGDKLREAVARHGFEPEEPLRVTMSVGMTTFQPGESFSDALKRADEALYRAKKAGRNCCIYDG